MVKNENGFGLVELIISIIVFSIVAASVVSVGTFIQNVQNSSRYREYATEAAEREIETLRNSDYSSLSDGQSIDFTSDLPSELPAGKSATVEVSEPSSGLKRVDVTVSYPQAGNTKTIELSAVIGELGITK